MKDVKLESTLKKVYFRKSMQEYIEYPIHFPYSALAHARQGMFRFFR